MPLATGGQISRAKISHHRHAEPVGQPGRIRQLPAERRAMEQGLPMHGKQIHPPTGQLTNGISMQLHIVTLISASCAMASRPVANSSKAGPTEPRDRLSPQQPAHGQTTTTQPHQGYIRPSQLVPVIQPITTALP